MIKKCDRMALALVIDTRDKVALNTHDDYQKIVRDAWILFGSVENLHLCIVTGKYAIGHDNDDVVFPEWKHIT